MRRIRRTLLIVIALTLLVALGACGGDDPVDTADPGAEPTDEGGAAEPEVPEESPGPAPDVVRVAYPGTPGVNAIWDVAQGMGVLDAVEDKFNTRFETTYFDTGPSATAALIGGAADLLLPTVAQIVDMGIEGHDVVALLNLGRGGNVVLVAPPEFEAERGSGLEGLKNYDGRPWGIISAGGAAEAWNIGAAEAAGLDWSAQNVVATGGVGPAVAAIEEGRLEIANVDAGTAGGMVAKGTAYAVFKTSGDESLEIWGFVMGQMLAASGSFVEEYPELNQEIVTAVLQGLLHAQELEDDPAAALELFAADYQAAQNAETWPGSWSFYQDLFKVTGRMTPEAIEQTVNGFMADIGRDVEGVNWQEYFADELVVRAYEDLGMDVPDHP